MAMFACHVRGIQGCIQWSLGNPEPRVVRTVLGQLQPSIYYYNYYYKLLGTVFPLRIFTLALSGDCLYVTCTMDVLLEVRIPG